jgi:tubulin--tyrosine ligase-like protein 12
MVDIAESDGEQVYLVDHAWTYRTEQARLQLTDIPGLAARLANLMDLDMVGTLLHTL